MNLWGFSNATYKDIKPSTKLFTIISGIFFIYELQITSKNVNEYICNIVKALVKINTYYYFNENSYQLSFGTFVIYGNFITVSSVILTGSYEIIPQTSLDFRLYDLPNSNVYKNKKSELIKVNGSVMEDL